MKYKILFIAIIVLFFNYPKSWANESCSPRGFTILTINGINTNEQEAGDNKRELERKLVITTFNNEPLAIDFLYNPTHAGGGGDLLDVIGQGAFKQQSDYDLIEILNSASAKIKTQKVLLVGHSQGNFYANNFYKKVADIEGGVPKESIGVYSVATPANEVSGGGSYITSDGDLVIKAASALSKVLSSNTHIEYKKGGDPLGHNFIKVYLQYRSSEIISGIKSSLSKLKSNDIQTSQSPCLAPQKISLGHKIAGVYLKASDFVIDNSVKKPIEGLASIAKTLVKLPGRMLALAGFADGENTNQTEQVLENTQSTETVTTISNTDVANPNINSTIITEPNISEPNILQDQNTNIETSAPTVDPEEEGQTSHSGGGSSSSDSDPVPPVEEKKDEEKAEEVVPDTLAPVITLVGEKELTIYAGSDYTDAGATAIDEVDNVIEVEITGSVDSNTIGIYTITYTASDKALNTATLTRTVNVIAAPLVDVTPPVITLNGNVTVIIYLDDVYEDAGAKAIDDVDGDISSEIEVVSDVDNTKIGEYTVTYTVVDKAEHTTTATRNVNVETKPLAPDIVAPVIELVGDEMIGHKLNTSYSELGATATDEVDGEVEVVITGEVNIAQKGNYTITYTAKDAAENISVRTRTVKVASYVYIPKFTFGTENGDSKNWQVWVFDGSVISFVYDWHDTYVNNYLKQKFKIRTNWGACPDCLSMGIFKNGDPQKGFEISDITYSGLLNNPQSINDSKVYDVVIQWDATGYTTAIDRDGVFWFGGHTDTPNVSSNVWVGWNCGGINSFKVFPSGTWIDTFNQPPFPGATGGSNMILKPYPVYDLNPENNESSGALSSEKSILSYNFNSLTPQAVGEIDEENHKVNITIPYGTDLMEIVPTITVSDKAGIYPYGGQVTYLAYNTPIKYTVVAEDNSSVFYYLTITMAPNPNPLPPPPDSDAYPIVSSYSLNGSQENITINPITNNLNLTIVSSKNVYWTSVKIEKSDNTSIYKVFYAGKSCASNTSTCTKIWDGLLSKGGLLKNGTYRIKVNMRDSNYRRFEGYLPSVITVNGQ